MVNKFCRLYNLNMNSRAQIVATLGKSSESSEVIKKMVLAGVDVARLNFSWGSLEEKKSVIDELREVENETGKKVYILQDVPGPRVQSGSTHTYDKDTVSSFTEEDRKIVLFGIEQKVDFVALSFVGSVQDVLDCKNFIAENGGSQKVIAKIERKVAMENFDQILKVTDAVMVARGDLGNEFPLEEIPFVQKEIISKCKEMGKPVIVATQMMLSMTDSLEPTRAEVSDVSDAISEGADAVMLSEETAAGSHPVEAVVFMEKIVSEAEKHLGNVSSINILK